MSYCVNCGVELAKSEKSCPLCQTPVINPKEPIDKTAEPPYPRHKHDTLPRLSRKTVLELITLFYLLPIVLSVICNISITGSITWSPFAVGALVLLWLITVSPIICAGIRRRSAPAFMIFLNFLAALCYLAYIEQQCGGRWFAGFAFPLLSILTFLILFLFTVAVYSKLSGLWILALSFIFTGFFCVCIETLINTAFAVRTRLVWSLYPMATLLLLGLLLLFINYRPALKEKLRKKFFI